MGESGVGKLILNCKVQSRESIMHLSQCPHKSRNDSSFQFLFDVQFLQTSELLVYKLTAAELIHFPPFTKPNSSLPCSQELAIGPHPEPH